MVRRMKRVLAALCIASTVMAAANAKQEAGLEAGRRAYEASDYAKAIQVLQEAAANDPQNGEVQLLLTKCYLELLEYDPAIKSAEKAVAIDAQNSVYHEWLGRAYGEKADHASLFSAMSLAKKTRKEFDTAIQLDGKNFSARQALIEFDCSAPAIVGGGEEKALPQIRKLPAAEERLRRGGRGICESAGEQSKIGGVDLRHRGLRREARPAGAAAGGRGNGRARGARRPAGKVLPGRCAGLEEGKPRGSRTIADGIRKKSADAIGISAACCGTRVARTPLRRPEQDGRGSEGI